MFHWILGYWLDEVHVLPSSPLNVLGRGNGSIISSSLSILLAQNEDCDLALLPRYVYGLSTYLQQILGMLPNLQSQTSSSLLRCQPWNGTSTFLIESKLIVFSVQER